LSYDAEEQGADARSPVGPELVESALRDDRELFAQLLATLSERLPYELVLFIEHVEEVFTQGKSTGRQPVDILRPLLSHSGSFKVIVTLRTEFFGQLSDRLGTGQSCEGVAGYLLRGLDEELLTEAILQPTAREPIPYADEIPFEKYGFAFDDGLAQEIARTALKVAREGRDSATAVVQAACAQLAEIAQTRADRVIHQADLKTIGGVEGALDRYVGLLVDSTTPLKADRRALRRLLPELLARQPGGVLSRRLVRESVLDERGKALLGSPMSLMRPRTKTLAFWIRSGSRTVAGRSATSVCRRMLCCRWPTAGPSRTSVAFMPANASSIRFSSRFP
jgi:hypothetical protein